MAKARNKLKGSKKNGTGNLAAGVALMGFSLLMLGAGAQTLPLSAGAWVGRLAWAMLCYLGVGRLVQGLRLRSLRGKLPRLESLFDHTGRVSLGQAAKSMNMGTTGLVRNVRELQKQGMLEGMYADLYRGELVYTAGPVAVIPPKEGDALPDVILREDRRKPVAPLYSLGLAWVLYAVFFPMLHSTDYLLAAILSLFAFFTTAWRSPEEIVIREEVRLVRKPDPTGNEALDSLLDGVQGHLADLRRLDRAIDGKLDAPVREMLSVTEQIVEQLRKNPQSAGQIRQFFNYTLPTTVGLLQNYEELSRQPVKGKNITDAMERIEGNIGAIVEAFRRQLDALFQDKALNIAVELEVMDNMLRSREDIGDILNHQKAGGDSK